MKRLLPLFFLILGIHSLPAQQKQVQGQISTKGDAELSILQILPDSFPTVSVVFKAESKKGEPVWGLGKEEMIVQENAQACEVISIEPLSLNHPIHLGIVFDHSGSMAAEESIFLDKNGNFRTDLALDIDGFPMPPLGYVSPIDHAKKAVKTFASTFDAQKDDISVIGFSAEVDKVLPLTHDLKKVNKIVDGMEPTDATAFYDALIVGMDEVGKADGLRVLVALTDGQDNSSKATLKKVISKAKKADIPIYVIGLGDVNKPDLKKLALETGGRFFHTSSGSALKDIYALISKQLQAFYTLQYASPNFSAIDTLREVHLSFDRPGVTLNSIPDSYPVPQSVIEHLKAVTPEAPVDYLLLGGIATATIVGAFGLILAFRRRPSKKPQAGPQILKAYPVPTHGPLSLETSGETGLVEVLDLQGRTVMSVSGHGTLLHLNLDMLPTGTYTVAFQANGLRSNVVKVLVRK